MRNDILREIASYRRLQENFSGKIVPLAGFSVYCAEDLLPPNNRVTRSFVEVIQSERAASVLDLGCGTGILALVASKHSQRVIGIDNNPIAVDCARLNASINHIDNTTFLNGNGFTPVEGHKFDLILCNPPFYPVIHIKNSPRSICQHGEEQDNLLSLLILGMSKHLKPGGKSLFVTSSLSENDLLRKMLYEQNLTFKTSLLSRGKHQEILLWTTRVR